MTLWVQRAKLQKECIDYFVKYGLLDEDWTWSKAKQNALDELELQLRTQYSSVRPEAAEQFQLPFVLRISLCARLGTICTKIHEPGWMLNISAPKTDDKALEV
jgi:hypothetical protein